MLSIYNLFQMNVRRYPERKALVTSEGTLSYRELSERAIQLADKLAEAGISRGSRVGIFLKNGSPYVEAILALFRLGSYVTFLNSRQRGMELARSISITQLEYIITDAEMRTTLVDAAGDSRFGDAVARAALISDAWNTTPSAYRSVRADVLERDPALNIFTGGTTGVPKAVVHTYGGLMAQMFDVMITNSSMGRMKDSVLLTCSPLFHIAGFSLVFQKLVAAGTVVLSSRMDVDEMIRLARGNHVTELMLVPPTIVERFNKEDCTSADVFTDVEIVIASGGACTAETIRKVFAFFPNAIIQSGYGMSERVGSTSFCYTRAEFEADPRIAESVGKPTYFSEVRLVDENGNDVPDGVPGELLSRGTCAMRGYLGEPSPFDDHGWFATGDVLYRDERGLYYFCSRSKDMIKSGGENVYANEVEDALLSHPAVAECAVVGIPDSFYGEAVAAAVVLRAGRTASADELIEHCRSKIASYKKPRKILFTNELPKSPVGKVLKNEIRNLFQ